MPHRIRTLAAFLLPALAIAPAADAKTARALELRFPRTVVDAGRNVEMRVLGRPFRARGGALRAGS